MRLADLAKALAQFAHNIGRVVNLRRRRQARVDVTEIELVLMERFQYSPKATHISFGDISRIVLDSAQLPTRAGPDVQSLLLEEEANFTQAIWGDDSNYSTLDPWSRWEDFELSLQTRASHFNRGGHSLLEFIFRDLGEKGGAAKSPVILHVDPGSSKFPIYRARFFREAEEAYDSWISPDISMGPPPQNQIIPGRMNTYGVPVFYGSSSRDAAIMETRPHVGGWVAVVRFEFVRPVSLLDITALQTVLTRKSVFHDDFIDELVHAGFFKFLGKRISRPVKPEEMDREYLATQAICEYLETHSAPVLDGMIFPSIQQGGNEKNVVLFRKSSRIEPAVFQDDDFVIPNKTIHDIAIARRRFRKDLPGPMGISRNEYRSMQDQAGWQARQATLRVDTNSYELFQVERLNCDLSKVPEKIFQLRTTRSES